MKILLLRLRLIGDVIFTTPAIAALRRRFPNASISYLVESLAAPVVRNNPHLDEVIVAARPRGWQRLRCDAAMAWRLRRAKFDIAIDFHGGPRSAWLTWASRATRRIGYDLPGRRGVYTERVPWTRSLQPPRHSVSNQFDLLAPLGIDVSEASAISVEMPVEAAAVAAVGSRLHDAGVPADAEIVVMHVSAGNPFRRWPADHFARVAAALLDADARRRVVITSGPSDGGAADKVAALAQTLTRVPNAIVRCGEFDLVELRALIERSALYIGGDSGPLHVASTSDIPIAALFGPTLPERSLPWRTGARAVALDNGPLPCRPCHQRHCIPGDFRCLTGVSPHAVTAAAERLLQGELPH